MTRPLALGLVLLATAASAADLATATRHLEPSRVAPSRKLQWAPSGNFQALHARSVFRGETEGGARPYGRARGETAAGFGIFLSRDSIEGTLNSAPSLHRFAYARENPLRYTDASGHCPNCIAGLAGAGIGFLVGFGVSSAVQLYRGEEFSWKKAAASGVGGAISGGMAGLTGGGSLLMQVGGGAVVGSVAGATATRTLLGQETTLADVRDDAVVGALSFGVVKGLGSAVARSSNGQMTAAIKELEKETVDAVKQAGQQGAAPVAKTVEIVEEATGGVTSGEKAPLRMNLGSGENPMPNAVNVEPRNVPGAEVRASSGWLPFKEGAFDEAHSINPYGYEPVNAETARVLKPGGVLKVTGSPKNKWATPATPEEAEAVGLELVGTGPVDPAHQFGQPLMTSGEPNPFTPNTTTTTYRKPFPPMSTPPASNGTE